MTRDDLCPTPTQCVGEQLDWVEHGAPQNPDSSVVAHVEWLNQMLADPDALAVLDRARRDGADLRRLLVAAATYFGWPELMAGPFARIRIAPFTFTPETVYDIDESLAKAEDVERSLGRPSADAEELRRIKAMLDQLDEDLRRHDGQPMSSFSPDGSGGWKEKKFIATGSGVAIGTVEIGPTQPGLRKSRGAPSDPALAVLLSLVLGHLRAVTGEFRARLAAQLLVTGFSIGRCGPKGGAAEEVKAMRARAYRCCDDARAEHRERAQTFARALRLPFRWD
jgi:hypothetical protein